MALPPRDSKGRFVSRKKRRRNVEFRQGSGGPYPIRHSKGYDSAIGDKAKKRKVASSTPARKPSKAIATSYYHTADDTAERAGRDYVAARYGKDKWAVYKRGGGFVRGTHSASKRWAEREADDREYHGYGD